MTIVAMSHHQFPMKSLNFTSTSMLKGSFWPVFVSSFVSWGMSTVLRTTISTTSAPIMNAG
jgi:hypothetical protein